MKKILVVLGVILILTIPALADVGQKARLNGENAVIVKVDQIAWNYGSGDINQDMSVQVTGNYQMIDQDSMTLLGGSLISDSDYSAFVNNTMKGRNVIRIDLDQYGNNSGSGSIGQSINVLVDNNVQTLSQDIIVIID
ncbi:hypothetical protein [Candidatus Methanoperedens nitratireducens]|uniref:Uncharacterized protein n=1 Tax=Candidatus Methanoperedens nitratireducens TaxID=1392998 RepID=A0A284VSF4_9EURY|nr:hypothetical protein [Candidatus Methanoperedens nitroreducens]SNQ62139.1 exported hypothetical protein [Candidatus Methanoperedens nitroreducens]